MEDNCNLIIVEDDEMVRECTVEAMTELGYNILCECKNGLEATEAFRIFYNADPIIILDMEMPLQNGYDTFRSFQKIVLGFTNIIIFCSPTTKTQHQIELMTGLGCCFLEKPTTYENMIPFIDELDNRPKRTFTKSDYGSEMLSLENEVEVIEEVLKVADSHHRPPIEYTLTLTKKRIEQMKVKHGQLDW